MDSVASRRGLGCLLAGVAATHPIVTEAARGCDIELRLLDTHAVPAATYVDGFQVGGLSGLDYDPRTRQWFLVSDDREQQSAARIFTATLKLDSQRISTVTFVSGRLVESVAASDAEALRMDTSSRQLILAGEGDRRGYGPWLRHIDSYGRELTRLRLPAVFDPAADAQLRGPRPNGSIEGLSFAFSGNGMWIALETPLLQDGPPATVDAGALVRLSLLDRSAALLAQYAYRIDAARAHPPGESSDSGVSEVLALKQQQLLVLERSGTRHADNRYSFRSRLYCADLAQASDVSSLDSLRDRNPVVVTKRLLYEFESRPGADAPNLEGMSWGPALGRGHTALVLVSDNNMSDDVATSFVLFSVRR